MRAFIYDLEVRKQEHSLHTGGNLLRGWCFSDEFADALKPRAIDLDDRLKTTFCTDALYDIKNQIQILRSVGDKYFERCLDGWARWMQWYCTILFNGIIVIGTPYINKSVSDNIDSVLICCTKDIEQIIKDFGFCSINEKTEAEYITDIQTPLYAKNQKDKT